ncbi:cytochrome c oxidase assembly factor 7 homolog isoform X2 [Coccinella septempunctata]|uniref:cytochrome c oxidase assembly factor 7 homolog isoform X2 n=1 Tax=Coccinella septempunctata TaxID=41139 RepID=UPI001D09198F|nr:cytochrome c oxidase assembly factor 7 homolog isoform X2 [Coccinella septempunctata]
MAGYDFKSEEDVKEFLKNLGIEYRFGCYSEKNPEVCHLLGDYLESIKKDFEKAAVVYKSTCDDYKYAKSCMKYGTYMLLGRGVGNADYKCAYDYFHKGCELNNDVSCLHQGLLTICENEDKRLVKDVAKGMSLLEKSCALKNANACYYLSGMYISGIKKQEVGEKIPGLESFEVQKDMKKAFHYALEGCNLGNVYSCANLSQMYNKGDESVKTSFIIKLEVPSILKLPLVLLEIT